MIIPKTKQTDNEKVKDLYSNINKPFRRGAWKIAKDLPSSFQYAMEGIKYAFSSQRNFRIHALIGLCVSSLGIWLKLSAIHLAIITLTISGVLVLELINTSIEAVVDLAIGRRFHPLARIAKDCAAASVLIASISSFIVALLLLFPLILKKFGF